MAEAKKESVYFQHILDAIDRIALHLGKPYSSDCMDTPVVRDAVVCQIEMLGGAAKHRTFFSRSYAPFRSVPIQSAVSEKSG